MTNRRGFITVIGGGIVLAAGAAVGLTAFPQGLPDPAAAWSEAGRDHGDVLKTALSYAILAPNPHNMQPWLADLRTPGAIRLQVDRTRLLPQTDPFGRQILIGCGAFLELLDLAARAHGAKADITLFPDGAPGEMLNDAPFALVQFSPAPPERDRLFDHILLRRTNREPFDPKRTPSAQDLTAVSAAGAIAGLVRADASADPTRVSALRDLVWRGWLREMETPAKLKESVDVMRIGDAAVAKHRDGIAMDGPMMNLLGATGMITLDALMDPNSPANQQGKAIWKPLAETAPAFVWQISQDNQRTTQILAGRAYARMALEATARGLAMHPWSMTLQEYPEMADLFAEQLAMLGATKEAPIQMLARIGYGPATPPAPRRGLDPILAV